MKLIRKSPKAVWHVLAEGERRAIQANATYCNPWNSMYGAEILVGWTKLPENVCKRCLPEDHQHGVEA